MFPLFYYLSVLHHPIECIMKKYLYSFLFLISFLVSQAQSPVTDSLLKLVQAVPDSQKINLWNDLSREFLAESPEKSRLFADSALDLSVRLDDQKGRARSLINIGAALAAMNKYDDALANYQIALKIRENIGDRKGVANAQRNIGDLFFSQKNYVMADKYLSLALNTYEELGNLPGLMTTANSIGNIYYDQNNYTSAVEYYNKALGISEELQDTSSLSSIINNIGSVYLELKDYSNALEYYERSLLLMEKVGDRQGIAISYNNIGYVYEKKGDHEKAIEYQQKSLEVAKELNVKSLINNAYMGLAQAYSNLGDYRNAYKFRTLSSDIKDTIFNIESNRNITEMQTRFDTERKEKENEILKQKEKRAQVIFYSVSAVLVLLAALSFFIYRSYRIKRKANIILAKQNREIEEKNTQLNIAYNEIEEKNKDITDSIRYAKRLQQAILPTSAFGAEFRDNGFILYKPKAIVSGDFYWLEKRNDKVLIAAIDCTGHGVPGAFMSIVGHNLLNQIVHDNGITVPSEVLTELNKGVTDTLKQKVEEDQVRDGMDLALCTIDYNSMVLEYAGAYNPLWLLRDGHMIEVKADKYPIGAFLEEKIRTFTNHRIELQAGDIIYMFSDGYADQFGGPTGKKFKYKNFKELLISIHKNKMHEQRNILDHTIEAWRGDLEQVDDIMVIGIKI